MDLGIISEQFHVLCVLSMLHGLQQSRVKIIYWYESSGCIPAVKEQKDQLKSSLLSSKHKFGKVQVQC